MSLAETQSTAARFAVNTEADRRLGETIAKERGRLRAWLRRQVADRELVEDIVQDVFYEFVLAQRLLRPIENAGAWLFQVARNRLIDVFRRQRRAANYAAAIHDAATVDGRDAARANPDEDDESLSLANALPPLPSVDEGPEALAARELLLEALADAIDALPAAQREALLAHEFDGLSFRQLAARTGETVQTLISRKHHAVRKLRRALRTMYDELNDELNDD